MINSNMSKREVHIMLDLETLGTSTFANIIRIGAVKFELCQPPTKEGSFDTFINPVSCAKVGLKCDGDTLDWWLQQPLFTETVETSIRYGIELEEALDHFSCWINKQYNPLTDTLHIWGNGSTSDNTWMESAYKLCNKECPWKIWSNKDLRTFLWNCERETGVNPKKELEFEGKKHDPIDDCIYQVQLINYCLKLQKTL